ncbi:hypothetical protein BCR41DRAFT_344197, partial [Lobosporangium transversale]
MFNNLLWAFISNLHEFQQRFQLSDAHIMSLGVLVLVLPMILLFLIFSVIKGVGTQTGTGTGTTARAIPSGNSNNINASKAASKDAPETSIDHRDQVEATSISTSTLKFDGNSSEKRSWGTMLGSTGFYGGEILNYKRIDIYAALKEAENDMPKTKKETYREDISWGSRLGAMGFMGAESSLDFVAHEHLADKDLGKLLTAPSATTSTTATAEATQTKKRIKLDLDETDSWPAMLNSIGFISKVDRLNLKPYENLLYNDLNHFIRDCSFNPPRRSSKAYHGIIATKVEDLTVNEDDLVQQAMLEAVEGDPRAVSSYKPKAVSRKSSVNEKDLSVSCDISEHHPSKPNRTAEEREEREGESEGLKEFSTAPSSESHNHTNRDNEVDTAHEQENLTQKHGAIKTVGNDKGHRSHHDHHLVIHPHDTVQMVNSNNIDQHNQHKQAKKENPMLLTGIVTTTTFGGEQQEQEPQEYTLDENGNKVAVDLRRDSGF